jgi:formylglycine-generating enzyme required for sulfatase activity
MYKLLWTIGILFSVSVASSQEMVTIPAGVYSPFFKEEGETDVQMKSFELDVYPVTNQQFLSFVKSEEKWQSKNVSPLFSETSYLSHWPAPDKIKDSQKKQPVVNVSWFAARAYCESKGKRLPTLNEWEHASEAQKKRSFRKNFKVVFNSIFRRQ